MTFQELKEKLESIGYSLEDKGCNRHYIINHKKINTQWYFWDGCIQLDKTNYDVAPEFCVVFRLKHTTFRLQDDVLTIGEKENPHIFVQFYNFNKKKGAEFSPEKKGCGKREYIKTEKGGTWAVCGCPNGWLCSDCSPKEKKNA